MYIGTRSSTTRFWKADNSRINIDRSSTKEEAIFLNNITIVLYLLTYSIETISVVPIQSLRPTAAPPSSLAPFVSNPPALFFDSIRFDSIYCNLQKNLIFFLPSILKSFLQIGNRRRGAARSRPQFRVKRRLSRERRDELLRVSPSTTPASIPRRREMIDFGAQHDVGDVARPWNAMS